MKVYIFRQPGGEMRAELDGHSRFRQVMRGMVRLKVRPNVIWASPNPRARQLALTAAQCLAPQTQPVEQPQLQPQRAWTGLWKELQSLRAADSVLLLADDPHLAGLAAFLLDTPQLEIQLKRAGLLRIDLESRYVKRPAGVLRWLLTSKHLRQLG